MSLTTAQNISRPRAGFLQMPARIFWLGAYLVLMLLIGGLWLMLDPGSLAPALLFPVMLGMAVVAGLFFGLLGAFAASMACKLVAMAGYFAGLSTFSFLSGGAAFLLILGFGVVSLGFSAAAAIAVGYSRRSEELVKKERKLILKVFDALPIGIWVRARDGRSLFVNERWASFSPRDLADIVDSDSTEPPVDLGSEWEATVAEVLDSEDGAVRYKVIDLTDQGGGTSSMTLLTLRMFIDSENDFGTLSLLVDESALRAYEAKIRESRANLDQALNNARMGFWEENIKTNQVTCDENWYHLIGFASAPEMSPIELWKSLVHPEDRDWLRDSYLKFYRSLGDTLHLEYRIRKRDEGYVWMRDSVRICERDADGRPVRLTGTMQDISEPKQAEIELKEAKDRAESANAAKSQFIAMISHEIRTPLNAIIGLSSFLLESDLDDERKDLAQTIYSSGKSLLLLVNDILDFSKIEAGRLDLEVQEYPLHLCFEDCVKLFQMRAHQKNIDLRLDFSPELTEFALGDMERLRQIIQNLISNAIKFTDAGEVTVSARIVDYGAIDPAHRPDAQRAIGYLDDPEHQYLEVCVEDSGVGISVDRQHLLFQAFSQVDSSATRKHGGTGLGLIICKRLVQAMGGDIWVESNEGEGARFSFVVRTQLIGEHPEDEVLEKVAREQVTRIAEEHPCDILIVGPDRETSALADACRLLGYKPHRTEDYELKGDVFSRRQYNLTFIWIAEEREALALARVISNTNQAVKSKAVIGCVPPTVRVSSERCRLNGMQEVIPSTYDAAEIRSLILSVLGVHD